MKSTFIVLFGLLSHSIFSQQTASWDGTYEGNIIGISSALTGRQDGNTWSATIDANSYVFHLKGNITGWKCEGTMTDPQTQTSIPFAAQSSDGGIVVSIRDINPMTGMEENMNLAFTKTNRTVSPQASGSPNLPGEKVSLDNILLGNWRYTESYVSGEFSFATDWHMQINNDGTFVYGEGRTAGGGPNSSIDSGKGREQTVKWKTEDQVIWLNDGSGWQSFARYYRENGNLMLTFSNGKRQVWEKI